MLTPDPARPHFPGSGAFLKTKSDVDRGEYSAAAGFSGGAPALEALYTRLLSQVGEALPKIRTNND